MMRKYKDAKTIMIIIANNDSQDAYMPLGAQRFPRNA